MKECRSNLRTGMIALVATGIGAATPVLAQRLDAGQSPAQQLINSLARVATSGNASVSIPANRASFSVIISTQAATAAAAGADNARIARAVNDALRQARLAPTDLTSSRLIVNPQWQYDEQTHRSQRNGFEATDTLQIETAQLERLGAYIDAALNAGATQVSFVDFSADDGTVAAARHQALAEAVADARADAEVMARAAGGTLGPLLELSTEQSPGITPLFRTAMATRVTSAPPPATAVVAGPIRITATVNASWHFAPASPQ